MKSSPYNIPTLSVLLFLCISMLHGIQGMAQLSHSGTPYAYGQANTSASVPLIKLERPNLIPIDSEDAINDKAGMPFRFAVCVKTNLNLRNSGQWETLKDDSKVWRLRVRIPGALALSCYFDAFHLPLGSKLFIYRPDHTKMIGAFTAENNQPDSLFATELIAGDEIILEYQEAHDNPEAAIISLSEIDYAYRGIRLLSKSGTDFGGSGTCEVNVNCGEGNDWKDEKQGVVRIKVRLGTSAYWCTGTLLNNVRQDYKPYVLTADHCGQLATTANLSQWIFYFNYETDACPDPVGEPIYFTLVGAVKKASSGYPGTITASDFYLVLLNNKVPETINPYFVGWSRENNASSTGVSIHHPQGDIKKISTYGTPTVSSSWTSTPNTHWSVKWMATANGHGVTEGGSSGAPLFNAQHLFMGQLSGGGSDCSSPTSLDYYGKFSYSWNPGGSDSTGNLVHWLDPDNANPSSLAGLKPNISYVQANFSANPDTIIVGNAVNFTDLSTGEPDQWLWTFKGGVPYQSTLQDPGLISYNKPGIYTVSLKVSNSETSHTITKFKCIKVIPNIYPNPFGDKLFIDMGDNTIEDFTVEAWDILGRPLKFVVEEINASHKYRIEFLNKTSKMIYLKIKAPGIDLSRKVMFINNSK